MSETEIWIPVVNGVPKPPVFLECPECSEPCRRRPGNVYACECGALTTLDLNTVVARRDKNGKVTTA